MTFDAMRRLAEDAEIAAVLATIPTPAKLELEPINDATYAPQSRVTLNATETLA
jgi:hypothetical protein